MRKVLFLIVLLSIVSNLSAQTIPSGVANPFTIYSEKIKSNDYLSPLVELQKDEFTKSKQWSGILPDLIGYLYSFTGDYKTAYAQLDRQREAYLGTEKYKAVNNSPIDQYAPQNALEAVAELAEKNQVVMINEEHDTPLHRAFTTQLLPILYAKGFRYLAAETFVEEDETTRKRGYPGHSSGFYVNDPVFGEMVRTALRLGFKLVPYEYSSEKLIECRKQQKSADYCQNLRETGQAQNLFDRTLKIDPQAKVFVHVGRGHNQQLKLDTWAQMGWHFKEIAKITPLSINQMQSERSEPKYESGLYRYVVDKWQIKEPTAFKNKEGNYFFDYGYNLTIFHPYSTFENGRPLWLKAAGNRKAEKINLKKLKLESTNKKIWSKNPILIQAFYANEGVDAVPADQIILNPNREIPTLLLSAGKYRIRAINETGKVIGEYQKNV